MRVPSAAERLLVVTGAGVVVSLVAAFLAPWQLAALGGWDVAAGAYVAWVWTTVGRWSPEETRTHATREDTSRVATSLILLSASVASLVGTGFDLLKAEQAHTAGRVLLTT